MTEPRLPPDIDALARRLPRREPGAERSASMRHAILDAAQLPRSSALPAPLRPWALGLGGALAAAACAWLLLRAPTHPAAPALATDTPKPSSTLATTAAPIATTTSPPPPAAPATTSPDHPAAPAVALSSPPDPSTAPTTAIAPPSTASTPAADRGEPLAEGVTAFATTRATQLTRGTSTITAPPDARFDVEVRGDEVKRITVTAGWVVVAGARATTTIVPMRHVWTLEAPVPVPLPATPAPPSATPTIAATSTTSAPRTSAASPPTAAAPAAPAAPTTVATAAPPITPNAAAAAAAGAPAPTRRSPTLPPLPGETPHAAPTPPPSTSSSPSSPSSPPASPSSPPAPPVPTSDAPQPTAPPTTGAPRVTSSTAARNAAAETAPGNASPDADAPPAADAPPSAPAPRPPPPGAEQDFRDGLHALVAGNPRAAIAPLDRACIAPSSSQDDICYWAAVAWLRSGDREHARRAFTGMLSRWPGSTHAGEANVALGWLLLDINDRSGARTRFAAAADDRMPSVRANAVRGLAAAQ